MIEKDIYDYLQPLMPELQWVNAYLDTVPAPKGDYATFNLINLDPIGWNISKYKGYDEEKELIEVGYTQEKIYTVQLDFFGANSLNNANTFRQILTMRMQQPGNSIGLKSVSNIRNLTELKTDKKYQKRYNFDIELFIVDEVVMTQPAIENATIEIVNRGNGETN